MFNPNLPTEDPNVVVPEAVKNAARRADEAFRAVHGPQEGEQDDQRREGANPETQAEASQEAQERQEDTSRVQEPSSEEPTRRARRGRESERRTREEQPREQQVEQAHEPQAQPQTQQNEWEQKYKSLQGRHNQTTSQVAALSEQVRNLQNMLSAVQHTPKEEVKPESYITSEDRETYGDEFLSVVERKAKELVSPMQRELQAKIEELNSRLGYVGTSMQANQRERMMTELDQQLPAWRELNQNENFIQWLQLPDAYSGAIRHELLKTAFEHNNTARVAAFFNGFLAEEAATAPQGQSNSNGSAPLPSGRQQTPRVSLENLAAPGRAKSAASNLSPAEKPIFTRAQIAQFYSDVTANRYRGREKDKNELEAKIFAAEREGRIR